jgi:anti-sigma regulatory factor (Ser/Thr protein kinase)
MTPPAQLVLPMDEHAPGLARRFLLETVCEVHLARVVEEAELLVSELITNGIVHGAPPVTLRLTCDAGRALRVEVADASSQPPQVRHPGVEETHGRGVELVDLLSQEWGVTPQDDGKIIWFTLTPVTTPERVVDLSVGEQADDSKVIKTPSLDGN